MDVVLNHVLCVFLGKALLREIDESRVGVVQVSVVQSEVENLSDQIDVLCAVVLELCEIEALDHVQGLDEDVSLAVRSCTPDIIAHECGVQGLCLLCVEIIEVRKCPETAFAVVDCNDLLGNRSSVEVLVCCCKTFGDCRSLSCNLSESLASLCIVGVLVDATELEDFTVVIKAE